MDSQRKGTSPLFYTPFDPSSGAFLERGYVPSPHSIYEGISKLSPGTLISFHLGREESRREERRFWDLEAVVTAAKADPLPQDHTVQVDVLQDVLSKAVVRQLISDVPLGAFLSGGIDSSLIVALMAEASGVPVKTFTIGFDDPTYDESLHASAVARHLGTDHTELRVTPEVAMSVIPTLSRVYGEPFADNSQIPTLLVSDLARQRVTVALTGDGGDEVFGGYNRYSHGVALWERARGWPAPVRRWVPLLRDSRLLKLVTSLAQLARGPSKPNAQLHEKIGKALRLLGADCRAEVIEILLSKWPRARIKGCVKERRRTFPLRVHQRLPG